MPNSYKNFLVRLIQICLVLSFFTPLIVGMRHLFPFVFPKALFFQFWVALGLIAYVFLVLHDKSYLPQKSVLLWLLGLWGLSFVLAAVFGFNPFNSLWSKAERMDSLWFYVHLFGFGLMFLGVLKTRADWQAMLKANALIGLLIGLAAIFSKYSPSLKSLGDQTRLSGTFGNPAFLATYFVIFIFLCLILVQYSFKRAEKFFWLGNALFGVILVLMSGSRGAYLGTVAGLGIWILGLLLFGSRQSRIAGIILICLGVGLGFSLVLARPWWEKTLPMIASRVYSVISIPAQRVLVWQLGLEAFKARPIFGWGQENFIHAFNQYFSPEIFKYEVAIFDRPHNKIIDVLVTTGAFGALSYLALFSVLAWSLFKRLYQEWQNKIKGQGQWAVVIGLLALWLAYQVQDLVLFEMPTSAIQLFFVLMFSLWFLLKSATDQSALSPVQSQPLIQSSQNRYLVFGAAAALIFWSIAKGTMIPFQASREFINAMVYLSQPMTQEYYENGRAQYLSARKRNTFLNKEFDINFSRHLRSLNVPRAAEWFGAQIDFGHQVLNYLEKDLNRHKQDYDILVEMSNLSLDFQVKYQDRAMADIPVILARAIKDAPNRFEAYEALVIYYSATENELGAKQNLDRLFALGPEVGDTWYYQALYNAQWGNHSEALDDLRRAKQYNFSLHDRPREQEWLLNLYVSRGRFEETLKFLEFLRTDPGASALHQLRYALLEIEVVYVSGDISRATSLLQELLARVSENDVPLIMHYLNSRNIILKP